MQRFSNTRVKRLSITRLVGPLVFASLTLGRSAGAEPPATSNGSPSETRASTAFFYGPAPVPAELMAHYARVVVEPDALATPPSGTAAEVFAYVSVGEVSQSRSWWRRVPRRLFLGSNRGWGSDIVDVGDPEWASFLVSEVIAPLYARGYRALFLDTLDSYQLVSRSDSDRARYERGLVQLVLMLKKRWPEIKLVLNRGFEILPRVAREIAGIAAESLFQGWDAASQSYVLVQDKDRQWLLSRLQDARARFGIPISVIDYVPASQRERRREIAKRILDLGFEPWVAGPALDDIGVGTFEIVPRKILILYRSEPNGYLGINDACALVAPVLEHLGYVPEYVDVRGALPTRKLTGLYAGIVAMTGPVDDAFAYQQWLLSQIASGMRVVFLGDFGFAPSDAFLDALGLAPGPENAAPPVRISTPSPYGTFEAPLRARARMSIQTSVRGRSSDVHPILAIEDARRETWDAVVTATWGGYAFDPYILESGLQGVRRWEIDPFRFLQTALDLPAIPAPDVTTESGNRILTVHVDGDGFSSRAQRAGRPYAGQVILDEVLRRYDLPHTVSVIEGEIGERGLDPAHAPALEAIARDIFALPNVEIASHSYSHAFEWAKAEAGTHESDPAPPHLPIQGYHFDLRREIDGSVAYINERLAPTNKHVSVFLWSGDCSPSAAAVERVSGLGLFNVNGGGATRTFDLPTITNASPLGIPSGTSYQVFAPIQNENVYTNNWRGPYYGFRDVIHTFALNESPRRISPLAIYFHFFTATKSASMHALTQVYEYALGQKTTPLKLSEYAERVLSFQRVTMARRLTDGAWQIGNLGALQTVRLDEALGWPDFAHSSRVVGAVRGPDGVYVHLLPGGVATLRVSTAAPAGPYVVRANGSIVAWNRVVRELRVVGHVPLEITLGGLGSSVCTMRSAGATSRGKPGDGGLTFRLAARDSGEARVECQ